MADFAFERLSLLIDKLLIGAQLMDFIEAIPTGEETLLVLIIGVVISLTEAVFPLA